MRHRYLTSLVAIALVAGCGSSQPEASLPHFARQLHQPAPPAVKAPVHVGQPPPGSGAEARADGVVTAQGASCGRERWNVKTATDPDAGNISLHPIDATIATLSNLQTTNPGDNPDAPRSTVEQQTYRVTAQLDAVKQEADSDFHLALSDGQGHTMIAEIPNAPACTEPPVTRSVSTLETTIEQARTDYLRDFGQPSGTGFTSIGKQVTVTGVLFFDKLHGQRNVAANGVELHPVTAISDP